MNTATLKVNLVVIFILLLGFSSAFAQDARTMLQFEDAEKAFNNGDYAETLKQLDQVEKQTGITSKTLYLRIVSENKIFDNGAHIYEDRKQFDRLLRIRNHANKYLKALSDQGIDDKYREVYAISETLQQFPQDEQAWREGVKAKAEELKRQKQQAEQDLYNRVVQQKTEEQAKAYLAQYPAGKYKAEVEKHYAEAMYAEGVRLLNRGDYTAARDKFMAYRSQFPQGGKIPFLDQKVAAADKGIAEQAVYRQRNGIRTYVLASYATDGNVGVEVGGMSTSTRVKMLLSVEGKDPFPVLNSDSKETIAVEGPLKAYFKEIYFTATVGANIRISYPLWVYGAAGIRESRVKLKEDLGSAEKGKTYKTAHPKSTQFFPELGLGVRVHNRFVAKSGVRLINGEPIFRLGVGVGF